MSSLIGQIIRRKFDTFSIWRNYVNSRKEAQHLHDEITIRNGSSVLSNHDLKDIKKYAADRFGSSAYWPWLALYSEVRGEFHEGWIPDEVYTFELLPELNPESVSMVSTVKSYDHRLFNGFAVRPRGIKVSGQYYDNQHKRVSEDMFFKALKNYDDEVVIKRDGSPSGEGLVFKHVKDLGKQDLNHHHDYLVQPVVSQHETLESLSSSSLNTIRIITMFRKGLDADLFFASLKFGVNGSRIDNVNTGGRFLVLNRQGEVASNAYDELGFDTGEIHPESGTRYKTMKVPSFDTAVDRCKQAHYLFPYVGLIAWDVCISRAGEPKLIEWNARRPGMWVNEAVAGPLWKGYLPL